MFVEEKGAKERSRGMQRLEFEVHADDLLKKGEVL